jgi:Major Facilitator Superfamily
VRACTLGEKSCVRRACHYKRRLSLSDLCSSALTYISVFTTLRERPIYNALIGLAWGTGAILGPVVAGAFSGSSATWRWAFYINLPLAAGELVPNHTLKTVTNPRFPVPVTAPIYIWLFPRYNPQPTISLLTKLTQIDWVGSFLNASTFVLFMIALSFSGSTWDWNTAGPITLWIFFGLSLILYVLQQTFSIFTTPQHRLFPIHFTKSRTLLLLYFTTAASASAMSICLYYVPLFFQFTRGDTALGAAVRLLPFIVLYVFFVMFSGALLPVFGRYAPWYFPSSILTIIGAALMYRVDTSTPTASIYGYEVLVAVGIGLIFQTGYTVAAAKVDPKDVPAAIGFINVAQIGSIAIALSISGAIFQGLGYTYLRNALASYDFPEASVRSALAGVKSVVLSGEDTVVRDLAIDAIVATIGKLYALVLAAGALVFVSACFMRWEKLKLDIVGGG